MRRFHLIVLLLVANSVQANDSRNDVRHVIYMDKAGVIVLGFQINIGGKSPQQFFEQHIDELMVSIDADKDGIITVEEARGKYLNAREAFQSQLIEKEVPGPDTTPDVSPADGKITRAEFLTYYKRIGFQPFVISYQPNVATTTPGNRPRRQNANTVEIPLFSRLDSNGDGKLSPNELTGALQTLRKLDLDDDETISAAELNPLANPLGVQQLQQGNATPPAISPFMGLGFDESLPKQVRRLIKEYDGVSRAQGSQNRDQKLNRQELGITELTFDRLDGDNDKELDSDELGQFLKSPDATISIAINLDTSEPLKAESTFEQFQDKLRTSPDGAANINLGLTQLSIVRGASNEFGNAEVFLKPQFMAADADANGYLEKSETERAFLFGATFENLDTDKNGKVFLDEAVAYFKTRYDLSRSRTVLAIIEQGRTLFEILDTDRDRRLSFRELQAAAGKLSIWDTNGDGLLSESEVPQQYRFTVARGNLPVLGGNFSANGMDQAGELAEKTSGPIWFRKMDKNRDGEVSHREFLGETITFEKFDRNHDGFIDLSESVQSIAE